MGRAPCCTKIGLHRGPWTASEDALLIKHIEAHGEGQWRSMPKKAGLLRCGKSCRLRWMNYLRPDIKRGNITPEEDDLIIRLHALLGNKWSLIAGRLPGRTDNEIKNYWNTHLSKKLRSQGTDPNTHKRLSESELEKLAKSCNKKRSRSSMNNNKHPKTRNFRQGDFALGDGFDALENKSGGDDGGEVGGKTKVRLPGPVGVKPAVISLISNSSNTSLESNNLITTSASSSQNQPVNQMQGLTPYDSENSETPITLDMPWLSSNNASIETNGLDDHLMMAIGSSCGNNDINFNTIHLHDEMAAAPENNDQQLEKLYEEYLQLIKVDHEHQHRDGGIEDGDDQLDSFTESFFI